MPAAILRSGFGSVGADREGAGGGVHARVRGLDRALEALSRIGAERGFDGLSFA